MLEWLYNNNILIYATHNEGKSVTAQRLKSIKKGIANDSKSHPS